MLAVASIVAPVFALVAMGAGARVWRVLDLPGVRALNDVTFYLLIPSLLFGAVVRAQVGGGGLDVAATYFAGCLLVFGAGVLGARKLLGARLAQASVIGLNCSYGNTVMLGVPIVSAAFGADGVAVLLPIIALHSVVLLPLATVLIEADGSSGHPARRVLRTLPALLRNPVIAAILLAALWRGTGWPLPDPIERLLALLSAAAPAMALLTLGASLPDVATQGSVRETGLAVVGKLVALPVLVWLLARAVGLGPQATAVAVVTATMPTGANAFFLARRTGLLASASAGTVVVSTLLSVGTVSVALALLH